MSSRHPDGWFHNRAVVGPNGGGFIDHWQCERYVDGQFLPEFMQMRVYPAMELYIRTQEEGRITAFVMCPDGSVYVLPFLQVGL